jgi:hypothetical protein
MEQIQHEDFYDASHKRCANFGTEDYYKQKWSTLRRFSQERFDFYDIALMMTAIVEIKGLRMIVENPWHPVNFTNHFWFVRPSFIDKDRTKRGDFYRKPTAYWFLGCEPETAETHEKPMHTGTIKTARGAKAAGLCSEERSMISPAYARNFIADFILGRPCSDKVFQQADLFGDNNNEREDEQ